MLTIERVHLPSDIPVVGCETTPYVLLRRPDGSVSTDDVPEAAPVDGRFVLYKWYRIERMENNHIGAVCSVHPTEQATIQCVVCLKKKIPAVRSYHCSSKCFMDSWQQHKVLHEQATIALKGNETKERELSSRFCSGSSGATHAGLAGSISTSTHGQSLGTNNGSSPVIPIGIVKIPGETWFDVGRGRTYTPTADDIGHLLRFECIIVDTKSTATAGSTSITTSAVISAPTPTPRRLIPLNATDVMGHFDLESRKSSLGTFTVLSYNILADAYATSGTYNYCPTWALSWAYRRQKLLREIIDYHADIICLQEVQSNHFEDFFEPELEKHGYQALFKKRTEVVYTGNPQAIDGCATFFQKDRFSHVKKYEVELNKAAYSLTDAMIIDHKKRLVQTRLINDNIALFAILEAKFSNQGTENPSKRQLLCVANTHLNIQKELKDVKLWQVRILLRGLEKVADSADISILVCGDFNSTPGSTPHGLLTMGKVNQSHPDLETDPLGILQSTSQWTHQLPLVSAYSSFARMVGVGYDLEQQRRRMDPTTNEPIFTKCTRDFTDTIDYIFYTEDSLTVDSLLELLDVDSLRKDTALPSPEWASDHIALLAEFRCKPRIKR